MSILNSSKMLRQLLRELLVESCHRKMLLLWEGLVVAKVP